MAFLPQEILFHEILPKLPVKSICRFKCVSKSFMALFNDPLFIKTHMSQTHRDKLLVLPESDLYFIDPETSYSDEKFTAKRLDFSKDRVYFIGSCNGLCCLYLPKRRVYFFYNPSIGECSKEIQIPSHMNEVDVPHEISVRDGFGYAPSIDDYKMVTLSNGERITHIFSLRNNSWKMIHQYEEHLFGIGTSVNGALHWLTYSAKNISIVSFNLVEEKFKRFPPLPDYCQSYSLITLYVVDDFLCMLVTKHEIWMNEDNVYEIWVMKEYGEVDSWTRILISKEYLQKPIYQSNYYALIVRLNRGMAFFLKDSAGNPILCYQDIYGTWKEVEIGGLPSQRFFNNVKAFRETLVSPNWYIGNNS